MTRRDFFKAVAICLVGMISDIDDPPHIRKGISR